MWKVLRGLFLGWGLGANHTANVFGTGYAAGIVKYRTAINESRVDRPEVQEALRKGKGSSIRLSKTMGIHMLYAALFVKEKGKILRLAVPMTKVGTFQNEVMILMSLALFLAPVFAIILTFFFIKYRIYEEDKSKRGKEEDYSNASLSFRRRPSQWQ
jgi:phosphate/sulfate permease